MLILRRQLKWHSAAAFLVLGMMLPGCLAPTASPAPTRRGPRDGTISRPTGQVGSGEANRLRQVLIPLFRAMDHPCRSGEARVGLVNQDEINAANAGGCEFYVTTGLLRRASDQQLRGVMAHEIAHQDLGHVAKAQVLGAGLNVGVAILEQLIPGSGAITPLAGTLIARGYGRTEEYVADRHAVEILRRAGYPKEVMVDALSWIRREAGEGGGGFLSTHPALDDRISALRRYR